MKNIEVNMNSTNKSSVSHKCAHLNIFLIFEIYLKCHSYIWSC